MYNFVIRCTIHYMTLREDSQQYYCVHHGASWYYTHYTGQTTQHQPSPSHFGALPLRLLGLGRLLYDDKFTFSDSFHTSQIDLKLNSSGVPTPNPPSLFITVDKEKYEEKGQKSHKRGAKWVTGTQKCTHTWDMNKDADKVTGNN